jgi:hypothetical protein
MAVRPRDSKKLEFGRLSLLQDALVRVDGQMWGFS